jgi:hypothetical protein
MHQRTKIKQAVKALLRGEPFSTPSSPVYAISEVAGRVYLNKVSPIWPPSDFSIVVFFTEESSKKSGTPSIYRRTGQLIIEIIGQIENEDDTTIDDIAEKIENIIERNPFLADPNFDYGVNSKSDYTENIDPANTVDACELIFTDDAFNLERSSNEIGSCRLVFQCEYTSTFYDNSSMDDFEVLHTETAANGLVNGTSDTMKSHNTDMQGD